MEGNGCGGWPDGHRGGHGGYNGGHEAVSRLCRYVNDSRLCKSFLFEVFKPWTSRVKYGKCLLVLLCNFLDLDRITVSFDKLYNTDFIIHEA